MEITEYEYLLPNCRIFQTIHGFFKESWISEFITRWADSIQYVFVFLFFYFVSEYSSYWWTDRKLKITLLDIIMYLKIYNHLICKVSIKESAIKLF